MGFQKTEYPKNKKFHKAEYRRGFFAIVFIIAHAGMAYCEGLSEEHLVNVQEISLDHITGIEVLYRWEKIIILQNDTDTFIIKEYMNKNKPDYYARISNTGNTLMVERGRRPLRLFINTFDVRAEVFIPCSYTGTITVKTKSGGIEAADQFICQKMNIESSSGHIRLNSIAAETIAIQTSSGDIRCERIKGNVILKTSSGSITAGNVEGNADAEASSGRIKAEQISGSLKAYTKSGSIKSGRIGGSVSAEVSSGSVDFDVVDGSILVKTSSGNIHCSTGENTEDISLTSSSGGVTLNIPRNFSSNFSSKTSSGALATPFPERLVSPLSDRDSVQGTTGGDNPTKNINIKTNSGSIRVHWIQ
jgi:DUF4097 and DUF4098 domain-containing protein YvlB